MHLQRIEAVARDVGRMADRALRGAVRDEEAFAGLLLAIEERVQAELVREPAGEPPACARGCAHCCTVNVGTLPVEGAAAAAWLRRRSSPAEARDRAAALLHFHSSARWQDDAERIRGRVTCPLLDAAGGCAIHPVRPLACRALSSLDAGECRVALAERGAEEGPGFVRQHLLQKALYDEALAALAGALTRRGLDARLRDVSGMAGAFLEDPARAAAWATGERVPID